MPTPNPSQETQSQWMKRCMHQLVTVEERDQQQAVAICLSMWRSANRKDATPFEAQLAAVKTELGVK